LSAMKARVPTEWHVLQDLEDDIDLSVDLLCSMKKRIWYKILCIIICVLC